MVVSNIDYSFKNRHTNEVYYNIRVHCQNIRLDWSYFVRLIYFSCLKWILLSECLIFSLFNVFRWCLKNQYKLFSLMPSMNQFEQKHIDFLQVHVQQEVIYRCFQAFIGLHTSTQSYVFHSFASTYPYMYSWLIWYPPPQPQVKFLNENYICVKIFF